MNDSNDDEVSWEEDVQKVYGQMLAKVPVFLRPLAKDKIGKKAENNACDNNRASVNEKDMIDAFFSETPFGFHDNHRCVSRVPGERD